jgi:hypothetical protein
MLKQNYNPKFASFYQKFDESKMYPSLFHIGIGFIATKKNQFSWGSHQMYVVGTSLTYPKPSKDAKKFAMFGFFIIHVQDNCN